MPARTKYLPVKLLSLPLLAVGLTACVDYTGPAGSRINGPQVQENGVANRTLLYSVEGFHVRDSTSLDYRRHLAADAVSQDGRTGKFRVLFLEKTTGRSLLESEFEVEPDLLFQGKIRLLHSEPAPPREALE